MGKVKFVLNRGYSSTNCRFFITIILKSMGWNIRDSMLLVSASDRLHVSIHVFQECATIHSCGW